MLFPLRRMIRRLWILCHLLYLSLEDAEEHQVSVGVILELGGSGLLCVLAAGRPPHILLGLCLLFAGACTREQVGYGDGLLLLALGMWLETAELLRMFFLGMGLGSLYALLTGEKEIPLVPFLTAAYMIGEFL